MRELSRRGQVRDRFILVQVDSVRLPVIHMVWDDAEAVVLGDLRQIVLSVILPERVVAPRDQLLYVVAADERPLHDLIKCRCDAKILLLFHSYLCLYFNGTICASASSTSFSRDSTRPPIL